MNNPLLLARSLTFLLLIVLMGNPLYAQDQDTSGQNSGQVANYKEQIKRLIGFVQFSLNTLGDPETSTKEKEVIINESYLKAFLDDEVQIEDDLDENREMITHKDVQAYLKDVDFFFLKAEFHFDIQDIQQQVTEDGMIYFKVTANRQLKGMTIDNEEVNNTRVRYIEVNLDDEEQVLKIASIYTTKLNEKEELMAWWNNLPSVWKDILGNNLSVTEEIYLKDIEFLTDTTIRAIRQIPVINPVDTVVELGGEMVHIQGVDTLHRLEYDTLSSRGTAAYRHLFDLQKMESLNVAGNLYLRSLDPVEKLTGLKSLNFSNTLTDNLFPVRNLAHLEVINLSGTSITDVSPIMYNIKIKEIYLNGTNVSSLWPLQNLQSIETLHFSNSMVDSLQPLTWLGELKDLRFKNSPVNDLSPLAEISKLEILDLSGTQVTTLDAIEFMTGLKMIYFENTEISDLRPLSKLNNLQVIDADKTPVSDLAPLAGLQSLEKIYCDQSGVQKIEANTFMLEQPGILVIYESEALSKWWSEMAFDWKSYFRSITELGNPPTIEQLHQLTMITAADISGMASITSLEPLSKLTNLKELRCAGSSISGLEPIKELIDLKYLDCSETRVKDLTPLRGLAYLREIDLSGSQVASLNGLEGAYGLEVIYMDNTPVDMLDSLQDLKDLRAIYCDGSKIGKLDIDRFRQKNPDCLIIYETPILDAWWNELSMAWQEAFRSNLALEEPPTREQLHELTRLVTLDLSENKAVTSLEPVTMLGELEKLDLSNTMVNNFDPLSSMITLKELNLSGNPIKDISPLSGLGNLTHLDISNTPVDRLDPVESLSRLEYLNCSGTLVRKLNPIETLFQLRRLEINNTSIKSLKPLEGMVALRQLQCFNTSISSKNIEKFQESNPQVEVVYY
jgi:hypothetical protein